MGNRKLVRRFRTVAVAEGISFLVLLGIAMPLKYFGDMPLPVTICGWIHGVLFVMFLALGFQVKSALNKNISWYAWAFIASILPFGTFVFDRHLKKEQERLPATP